MNQNKTIIIVNDDGTGIKNENLKSLFSIGDQFKTIGTANEEGLGLGLILCKEFVEKNKGNIWVQSAIGEGSSFSFSLPNSDLEQHHDDNDS